MSATSRCLPDIALPLNLGLGERVQPGIQVVRQTLSSGIAGLTPPLGDEENTIRRGAAPTVAGREAVRREG